LEEARETRTQNKEQIFSMIFNPIMNLELDLELDLDLEDTFHGSGVRGIRQIVPSLGGKSSYFGTARGQGTPLRVIFLRLTRRDAEQLRACIVNSYSLEHDGKGFL
jgi:hypothetical protein